MTTEFAPFLQQTFPLPVLQERVKIVLALARYASSSWRDIYSGQMEPGARTYVSAVEAVCSTHFFNYIEVPKRAHKMMRQPGDTTELVLEVFDRVIKDAGLETQEFGTPHFGNEELETVFSKRFGTEVISMGYEANPTVLSAFQQAFDNYRQAQTRLLAYTAIYHLTRISEYNDSDPRLGCPPLRTHLWERTNHFMRDMLVFSGLLGGQAHVQVLKLAARNMCHKEDTEDIQYSIIQFLTADGRVPGMYASETSKRFAADIREKYDAL
jgi:hypothetical protein